MREILFRAKCIDNGEWVYGVPIKKALAGSHDGYYPKIIPECDGRHQTIYSTAIKEETLGQYTGLTDKNGTKIFEGDICWFYGGEYYSGSWEYNTTVAITDMTDYEQIHYLNNAEYCEIIGNIHDNPELLEVEII